MSGTFKPRLEILPPGQQRLWPELKPASLLGFVLYGGDCHCITPWSQTFLGPNFQPSESLKAMVYFEDGDLRTLTKSEKNTLVKAVSAVRNLPRVTILSTQLAPFSAVAKDSFYE